jgi:hypothetical protein
MGIMNRRNAVIGWTVWQLMKRVAMQKAKSAVPKRDAPRRRPRKVAILGAVAAVGALVFVWRRKSSSDDLPPAV